MARTPFKLRSGNTTPFKSMGSSPMRQDKLPTYKESYTAEVEKKWKDKGGFPAYKKAAIAWNVKQKQKQKTTITKTTKKTTPVGKDSTTVTKKEGTKKKSLIQPATDLIRSFGKFLSSKKTPKLDTKEKMARKYGTGEYKKGGSKAKSRMKAGESKFKYDVRMKKEAYKTKLRKKKEEKTD